MLSYKNQGFVVIMIFYNRHMTIRWSNNCKCRHFITNIFEKQLNVRYFYDKRVKILLYMMILLLVKENWYKKVG